MSGLDLAAPLEPPLPHGLERAEWVRRFTVRIGERLAVISPEREHIAEAELESWPEPSGPTANEWRDFEPEEAADEQISYWGD